MRRWEVERLIISKAARNESGVSQIRMATKCDSSTKAKMLTNKKKSKTKCCKERLDYTLFAKMQLFLLFGVFQYGLKSYL